MSLSLTKKMSRSDPTLVSHFRQSVKFFSLRFPHKIAKLKRVSQKGTFFRQRVYKMLRENCNSHNFEVYRFSHLMTKFFRENSIHPEPREAFYNCTV